MLVIYVIYVISDIIIYYTDCSCEDSGDSGCIMDKNM